MMTSLNSFPFDFGDRHALRDGEPHLKYRKPKNQKACAIGNRKELPYIKEDSGQRIVDAPPCGLHPSTPDLALTIQWSQ